MRSLILFWFSFILAHATNIAPEGTAIFGRHTSVSPTLGTPYSHVNPPSVLNDGNNNASSDTWTNNTNTDHSYIGITWPTPRTDQITTVTVDFSTFLDGGWFGENGRSPAPGAPLDVNTHHKEPTMQITTNGGSTWTNVAATSNYPSRLDGHEIGGGGNPNPTQFSATWTLTNPQTNINGIRLIGEEGGNAGADSNGFIAASEITVDARPTPIDPVLIASPINLSPGQISTLSWDLPDGVASATLQTSAGTFLANITTDTGSLAVGPSGIATYHLVYGNETAVATVFSGQSLVITEFMAANSGSLTDEDGDTPDWIEVYNASTSAINTAGWKLNDDASSSTGWTLPSRILAPGDFLLVFASSKNRAPGSGELHTDFSLSSSGEDIVLLNPAGQVVSAYPAFGPQIANASFGLPVVGTTENPESPSYFKTPTPGFENNAGGSPGPVIEDVTQNIPAQPANTPLTITARVSSLQATISSVTLHHRRMFNAEQNLAMNDNGIGGDAVAGDGLYTTTIPASQLVAGEMVRWSVSAVESTGIMVREPAFESPNSSPEYFGTIAADPSIIAQLPVIHWFVSNPLAATVESGTRSSIFFNGEFYDNVFTRRRGNFGSTLIPKKSIKVDFNKGHHFKFDPNEGRVEEINLNTTDPDKSYIRRILSWHLYELAGVPGSLSHNMNIQQNGSFHGVWTFVEQPDRDFLKREDLLDKDGALYKMFNQTDSATSGVEKKTRRDEGNSDLQALVSAVNSGSSTTRNNYLWDNVNIPGVINYLAASRIMHENDDQGKNYYLHRNTTTTGEWTIVPWDKDLTWGRNYTLEVSGTFQRIYSDIIWADNDTTVGNRNASPSHPLFGNRNHRKNDGPYCRLSDAILINSTMRQMYLRRLRTQMDELLQPSSVPLANRIIENRMEELYNLMNLDVAQDRTIWASPNPPYGAPQTFRQAIDVIKNNYLPRRRSHFYNTHTGTGTSDIPNNAQPTLPNLTFGSLDFNPSSQNQDQEYVELINNENVFIDVSGWQVDGGIRHTLEAGTVIPPGGSLYLSPNAIAFRQRITGPTGGQQRFVQGNYSGKLSNFGETLTLSDGQAQVIDTLTYLGDPTENQLNLVISEIMYDPANPDAEFIELTNISDTLTLDLAGVTFTNGFDFTFPPGTTLAPGARTLVVLDQTAFESVHGNGLPIDGTFASGRLSNGGESIKLDDADGSTIHDFEYDNNLPWPTSSAGGNFSLVLINPASNPNPNDPQNWRPSFSLGGNPGEPLTTTTFAGNPNDDLDRDGVSALVEHALGTSDTLSNESPIILTETTFSFSRNLAADDVQISVETSTDLVNWQENAVLINQTHNNNGTLTETWGLPSGTSLFARLKVSLIP
ncbi:MAG: lamin tail domain-containing protein [Akkermansiaceae bacterium]